MSEVLKMSKKAFTVGVVATTIAWSMGLAGLVAPLTAKAATAGSLVKASLPAVYYVGNDGKRYVFPNEKTYKTWYSDFSGVMVITDAELAAMPIGGNVTYKPGTRAVKITTDPKVYAVDAHGTLRWMTSEAAAIAIYGANWNQQIDDVSDAFFTNYSIGADIASSADFNKVAIMAAATSINTDKNLGGGGIISGSLTVALDANQTMSNTLPRSATGVNFVKFDVHNGGSASVALDSVTVHRVGPGSPADFANVYVYEGNNRLTTGRTINSSTNQATFSGLNLTVNAGETKVMWISADISAAAGAGNVEALEVVGLTAGTVSASGLPVRGQNFTVASATVGNIIVDKTGTISNPKSGQMGAKVGQFRLTAGAAEDLMFSKISLYYAGSLSRDFVTNITLKQAGLTIATVSAINSKDMAVLVLTSPMLLEKGSSKTYEVFADVSGAARNTDDIKFYLDQTTDLLAIGNTYGFGVQVIDSTTTVPAAAPGYDGTACTAVGAYADCNREPIDAGQMTISFNGPAAKNIAANGKKMEVLNYTMAPAANIEVRQTQIRIDSTAGALCTAGAPTCTTPIVKNLEIVDTSNGAIVAGPQDVTAVVGSVTQTFTFTEVYNLIPGQSKTYSVVLDLDRTAPANMTVQATLIAFGGTSLRNLDSSTYLGNGDIVPSGNIAGNVNTVKKASLAVSVASTPVSQTVIQGSQGVPFLGISLKAGDASNITVSSIRVQGYVDSACTGGAYTIGNDGTAKVSDLVLTAGLWNGSTQLGQTKSPASNATVGAGGDMTFDNLNLTIPASQTVSLLLNANIPSSIATLPDCVKFDIASNGDVSATDNDGNSLVASTPSVGTDDVTGTPVNGAAAVPGIHMTVTGSGTLTVVKAPDDTESEAGLVVGGGTNVVLAKYKFTAQNEELKVTKVRMMTATANAVSSLSLYDGSTLVGGPTSPDGLGNADFTGMNFVIPKDGNKVLTVKGNLNTVGTSGALTGSNTVVSMRNADTSAGTFEARGTSAGSNTLITAFGVKAVGTVTFGAVAAPADTVTVGTFVATAGGNWTTGATAATSATSLAALINANVPNVTATALVNVVTITAKVAGVAGNAIALAKTGVPVVSGATLAGGLAGDLAANPKIIRKTKPTVALVALPQTVLSTGTQSVMRFTVSADAAGDVSFKHVQVAINETTNVIIGAIGGADSTVRRVGDSANLPGATVITANLQAAPHVPAGGAAGTLDIFLNTEEIVSAGTSRTYDVRLNITGTLATGDSLAASLTGEAAGILAGETGTITGTVGNAGAVSLNSAAGFTAIPGSPAQRNFVWSDISAIPHSDAVGTSSADWTNGVYVKVVPTDSQTMSK